MLYETLSEEDGLWDRGSEGQRQWEQCEKGQREKRRRKVKDSAVGEWARKCKSRTEGNNGSQGYLQEASTLRPFTLQYTYTSGAIVSTPDTLTLGKCTDSAIDSAR